MDWLERMGQVVRSQINSLITENEDPEKILEEAVMNMEQQVIEMRKALAAAIATHKRTERQFAHYQAGVSQWYERAQLALNNGNEALARDALTRRVAYQTNLNILQTQLEQQKTVIQKVRADLQKLEHKYLEAKAKKNLYVAQLRSAMAHQRFQEIAGNLNTNSSLSVFEQIEAKILELDAQSELMTPAVDPLEQQFATLEGSDAVEAQLNQLKAKRLNPS